jgi:hypothetical protein
MAAADISVGAKSLPAAEAAADVGFASNFSEESAAVY